MPRYPDEDTSEDVTCLRCGEEGLSWHYTGVRYILIDENARPHVCKPSSDDFDEVTP